MSRLLLERLRADHPEREITGLKLAVGGWSSFQGLQQMKRDVVPLRPRVVTVYYGWNDHWIGYGVEDEEVYRLTRWPPAGLRELRLAQLIFKGRMAWAARRSGDPPKRVSASDFRRNLEEIVALARRHDILPVREVLIEKERARAVRRAIAAMRGPQKEALIRASSEAVLSF